MSNKKWFKQIFPLSGVHRNSQEANRLGIILIDFLLDADFLSILPQRLELHPFRLAFRQQPVLKEKCFENESLHFIRILIRFTKNQPNYIFKPVAFLKFEKPGKKLGGVSNEGIY